MITQKESSKYNMDLASLVVIARCKFPRHSLLQIYKKLRPRLSGDAKDILDVLVGVEGASKRQVIRDKARAVQKIAGVFYRY